MAEQRLGELLLNSKTISNEQREKALEIKRSNPSTPIGQILRKLGFISEDELQDALDYYHKREQLGTILVGRNLLTDQKLNVALEMCAKEHIQLGRALLKLQLVNELDLAKAIASQFDLPFMELNNIFIPADLGRFINPTYARHNQVVPIDFDGQTLTLAATIPLPRDEIKQMATFLHFKIKQVIATENDILVAQQAVDKVDVGAMGKDSQLFELVEDGQKEGTKSRYAIDFISTDVEYLVKKIISTGIIANASDIHLEPTEHGMTIRYRIDGALQERLKATDKPHISKNCRQIISRIKILCDMDIAERRRPQDSSFKMKVSKDGTSRSIDFRVSTVPTRYGENLVMRILDKKGENLSMERLGYFPEMIHELFRALEKPTGIFLVTGPTGSGKTSTLYALLSHINKPETKTLTVEDPIEYSLEGISQTEINEVIGNTFAKILRSFLRQDPDNIMVGEIRDSETAMIAIRAALTGHTVLSTLHTSDATSAVTRLIDMGVEGNLLSLTLRCVIAQRLVRKNCEKCRKSYKPEDFILTEFSIPNNLPINLIRSKGCPACNYTGFSGRLPVTEMWLPTKEELLLLNRRPDNIALRQQVFGDRKRTTLIEDGMRRVFRGETPLEELLKVIPAEQIETAGDNINWENLAAISTAARL